MYSGYKNRTNILIILTLKTIKFFIMKTASLFILTRFTSLTSPQIYKKLIFSGLLALFLVACSSGSSNSSDSNVDTSVKFNFEQSHITVKYKADLTIDTNLIVKNIDLGKIRYESDTTPVVTIDNGGLLTIRGVGTATITAIRSTDSKSSEELTSTFLLTVLKGDQTALLFEKSFLTIKYVANSTRSNVAQGGLGTGAITYSIDNTNVATIATHTGVVTLQSIGTATVTATRAADANYTTISNSYILEVNNKENQPDLSFAQDAIILDYQIGGVTTSNIAQGGTGTGAISYRSNNEDIAIVDSSGVVTIKSAGKVRITAIKAGDNTYNPIEESYILTVNKIVQTDFRFTQSSITLTYLTQRTVTNIATGGQGTGKIRYKIDKTTFATIDADSGQVTINGAGMAIITATKAEDTNYQAISSSYVLVVNKAQQTGFGFVQASIIRDYVQDATISNVAKGGQSEGVITYRSDNRNVATVNSSGVVTLQGAGTATITATKAEDANYKVIENSYELTVNKGEQTGFKFARPSITIAYVASGTVSNIAQGGQSEGAVTYSIDNSSVATVDSNGEVTLKRTGKATITATKPEDDNYKAIESSYKLTVNKGKQTGFRFVEDVLTVAYAKGKNISNIPRGGQGSGAITYDIDNTSVATINSTSGEVTINSTGTATIIAMKAGDDNYLSTSATYSLNVVGLSMALGIKNIKFAWGAIEGKDHYRLQSDLGNGGGFVDASTTGFVVVPNSTNIKQTTAQADIVLHRYIPLINGPKYRVEACDETPDSCDTKTAVSNSLSNTQLNQLIGYFKSSNKAFGGNFGGSVSISDDGNSFAAGSPDERGGSVSVFVRDSGSAEWTQQAHLKGSSKHGDKFGFSVSLSGDGNTLAVGVILEDGISTGVHSDAQQTTDNVNFNAGAVYVFTRNSSATWSQQAYIKASNAGEADQFGYAVSLSDDGNSLAVGAVLEDSDSTGVNGMENNSSATNSGAVYVFTRSESTWKQQAYIKASNTDGSDFLGSALSLSGDGNSLAVGATGEDSDSTGVNGEENNSSANKSGAVYVFTRSGDDWSQQAYIKASNSGVGDEFGWSISLSDDGNTLAVGAIDEDGDSTGVNGEQTNNINTVDSGAAYVFTRSGSTWSQQAYIKASNTGENDLFGTAVSLSGDGNSLVVGARLEDSNATGVGGAQGNVNQNFNAGAVYFFTRNGVWSQQAYVKASNTGKDDEFGTSVSLSDDGNSLVVGAPNQDGGVNDSGAVYLY